MKRRTFLTLKGKIYFFSTLRVFTRPELFKGWILLSSGLISIHCISMVIFPMNSGAAIHPLNNWGQITETKKA